MSAAESLGSHQLNSFAAFLEEKLHTSSENSIVQIPQLKNMADGKKPQKGGIWRGHMCSEEVFRKEQVLRNLTR